MASQLALAPSVSRDTWESLSIQAESDHLERLIDVYGWPAYEETMLAESTHTTSRDLQPKIQLDCIHRLSF
jgi:hypothetical protein